ncbi:MBL fold metallo-hydrolase [Myxococcus sp. AM001]|nr:MBL fold metallo-hydrolase [Myxococcus sp. AM001]
MAPFEDRIMRARPPAMSNPLFSIEMLPADHGDCILLTYGSSEVEHRVLIDGGTARTFPRLRKRLEALPPEQREFELLIVTHIDSDHIDGVLPADVREGPWCPPVPSSAHWSGPGETRWREGV